MNQLCKVCGEPAAGFHFGAFTCEGCKSFFGRTYNNLSQVHECKNGGQCVINKQNRTSCKACRLRKCLMVGMSKSGSRYGRRSNWFKIHCLLQEQAAQMNKGMEGGGGGGGTFPGAMAGSLSLSPASMPALSPVKSEDDAKVESPILSSPESCPSETSVDVDPRRTSSPKDMAVGESGRVERFSEGSRGDRESGRRDLLNAAGLSLYGLHPSISLLHASQWYSRLYPPVLYPGLSPSLLAPPGTLNRPHPPPSPPKEPSSSPRMCSPASFSPQSFSPRHSSPRPMSPPGRSTNDYRPPLPPPLALPLGFPLTRKRVADSPVEEMWEAAPAPEQDAPIDLSVKRPRMLPPPSPSTLTPVSPPVSPVQTSIPTSTTPVDLTTKA